ncbi:MAG: hypothetical protein WCY11_12175 [Novosphingobium sp.]
MVAILLATLFAAAAVLSLAAIADSWKTHGGAMLALRQQLRECSTTSDCSFRLITTHVQRGSATIYWPTFRPSAKSLPFQPERYAA